MSLRKRYCAKQHRPVMTITEAARTLGVSYPTAHLWAHNGHLPTVKIGPKTFVLRDQFDKLFQQHSHNDGQT